MDQASGLNHRAFTAFIGQRLLLSGTIEQVVRAAKAEMDRGTLERIAIYEDSTGSVYDFDWRGTAEEVVARLAAHPVLTAQVTPTPKQPGPGRPALGVVPREVTLLPRHWEWLGKQRGGASAAIRRLVDEARIKTNSPDSVRNIIDTVYKFLHDQAANLPDFEEASRALYAKQWVDFETRTDGWPVDIRDYALRLLAPVRPATGS